MTTPPMGVRMARGGSTARMVLRGTETSTALSSSLIRSSPDAQGVEEDLCGPPLGQMLLVDGLPAEELPLFDGPAFPEDLSPLEVLSAQLGLGEGLEELGLGPGELGGVHGGQDLPGSHPASQVHPQLGDLTRHQGGHPGRPVLVHREGAGEGELGGDRCACRSMPDPDPPILNLLGFRWSSSSGSSAASAAPAPPPILPENRRQKEDHWHQRSIRCVSPHRIPPPTARSSSASSRFQS